MRQAIAKVIGIAARENLSLRFQTAKGAGMNDTVAIPLKGVAVGVRRLGVAASVGIFYVDRIRSEVGIGGQTLVPSCQFNNQANFPAKR